ncbi:MAG: dCTP deaminase [Patescibacteria group bacterium]
MSVLTKKEIIELIYSKKIIFSPDLDQFQMQPHAIDLRLGYHFYLPKTWHLTENGREIIKVDPLDYSSNGNLFEVVKLKNGQFFELMPKEFVIGVSLEKIKINQGDIMAVLYPRSSINRRGLSVDLSGIIDVWYEGNLMVPIINNTETQPIRIYPGERFCQVVFQKLSSHLNKNEASLHGIHKAKYVGSCAQTINSKIDKKDETDLIKKGQIDVLKKKYCF